jgi:long-chain acyl-CoA synthetase
MNLAAKLLGSAAPPDAPVLAHAGGTITAGELADQVARVAGGLRAAGVVAGDRVAIMDVNTPVFVVAYLAALWCGGVAVPINPHGARDEVRRELDETQPRALVVGPAGSLGVRDALAAGSRVPIVVTASGVDVGAAHATEWPALLAAAPIDAAPREDGDLAVLLFTAGTAGAPKAAMLTHGNLGANLDQIQNHPNLALRATDVSLALLPFFHVFGLNVVLGVSLFAGASVVLVEGFDPPGSIELIRRHAVTVVAAVPPIFGAWLRLDDAEAPPDAFAGVRLAVSGAAALIPAIARGMSTRFGVAVHDGYGLTEASPVVTTTALGGTTLREGSIGPPLPGVEVRLVDGDGTDVLVGDPGEIWVKGANVFSGYWNDPETTAKVLTPDGWLRTGDVAVSDDDGYLELVDRAKDLIIVNGFNVYPAEVEDVLREHSDVGDVAVVGRPSDRTGEQVVAFVVPTPGRGAGSGRVGELRGNAVGALQATGRRRDRRRTAALGRRQGSTARVAPPVTAPPSVRRRCGGWNRPRQNPRRPRRFPRPT